MYSFCPSLVWSSPWEVVQHPAQQKSEQMGSRAACVSLCPHLSPLVGDEILPLELREGSSPCCPWGAPQFEEKCFMAGRVRLLTQHCTSHPPGAPLGREHQAAQLLCKWDLTMLLNVDCSSTYWCRLHSMSLWLQSESNAEFISVQCIYKVHVQSMLTSSKRSHGNGRTIQLCVFQMSSGSDTSVSPQEFMCSLR